MKKARILLTAITVLAVVGGALAFKAKSPGNVYCRISPNSTLCALTIYTTDFIEDQPTTTQPCVNRGGSYYTTISANGQCLEESYDLTVTSVPE